VVQKDSPLTDPDLVINPAQLTINGEALDPLQNELFILMHKPADCVCTHDQSERRVFDLLPPRFRLRQQQVISVGRLDKDTTGLLILTDNGAISHRLTSPKHHVAKTYHVTLADPLKGDEAALFASGTLMLRSEDKPLLPAQLEVLGTHTANLTLHEGRYHQVKRMFAATGNKVTALHRSHFGPLTLGHLAPGEWRLLTHDEIISLKK
jgi:16S rRNA pseudouridine516 synthase